MRTRRKTRQILVGSVPVGRQAPISVQGMTKSDSRDPRRVLAEVRRMVKAGAEIVRIGIPDEKSLEAVGWVKDRVQVPIVGDIHFDYRLAQKAIRAGLDGIRINPGNIGGPRRLKEVAETAKEFGAPLRIGINSGSLEKDLRRLPVAEGLVQSALRAVEVLENMDFHSFKISLKSSDVSEMVEAHRLISKQVDYPLHLGVTEAGPGLSGIVKSTLGIGILLAEGIGDTIRVSLTGPSVLEIRAAWQILRGLGLRSRGAEIVSCPTCTRDTLKIQALAEQVEKRLASREKKIKVAVMGCPVNGPGEASRADVGLVGSRGKAIIYFRGRPIGKRDRDEAVKAICELAEKID